MKRRDRYRWIFFFIFIKIYLLSGGGGFSSAEAASLSVLPVLTERLDSRLVRKGPALSQNIEKNNWQLAQLIQTSLFIGGLRSLNSQDSIKRAYQRLHLNSKRGLETKDLSALAREIDTEKMLLSTIKRRRDVYIFVSKVFYVSSGSLTDTIQTSSPDIWDLIDQHLRERFPYYRFADNIKKRKIQKVLFLLDASGANFKEIRALTRMMKRHEKLDIGICALQGDGSISFLKTGSSKSSVIHFLSRLSPRGGSRFLRNTFKALGCLERIFPIRLQPDERVKIVILASSIPNGELEKRRTKLTLRRFSRKADILLVGSSILKPPDRIFWQETIAELSGAYQSLYKDLLYRQTLGLASGDEAHIFKKGEQLIQRASRDPQTKPDFVIDVPAEYWPDLEPDNIRILYEKISRNRVISAAKTEILMEEAILDFLTPSPVKKYDSKGKYVKLLIEIEKVNFWIYLPKKVIYSSGGIIKIKREESYYFMLNMTHGSKGIPFRNDPDFGLIYKNLSGLPRLLLLNFSEYLKNLSRYLDHSVGGSSLYIFFAKVKIIKI